MQADALHLRPDLRFSGSKRGFSKSPLNLYLISAGHLLRLTQIFRFAITHDVLKRIFYITNFEKTYCFACPTQARATQIGADKFNMDGKQEA